MQTKTKLKILLSRLTGYVLELVLVLNIQTSVSGLAQRIEKSNQNAWVRFIA